MTDPLDDEEEEEDEETYFGGPLVSLETTSDAESKPARKANRTRAKKADELVHKTTKRNASSTLRHKA